VPFKGSNTCKAIVSPPYDKNEKSKLSEPVLYVNFTLLLICTASAKFLIPLKD
jgi:hypothetical protein